MSKHSKMTRPFLSPKTACHIHKNSLIPVQNITGFGNYKENLSAWDFSEIVVHGLSCDF